MPVPKNDPCTPGARLFPSAVQSKKNPVPIYPEKPGPTKAPKVAEVSGRYPD